MSKYVTQIVDDDVVALDELLFLSFSPSLGGCLLRSVNQNGSAKGLPSCPKAKMPQVPLDTRCVVVVVVVVVADKKMLQALYDSMPILPSHPTLATKSSHNECRQIWQLNVDARVAAAHRIGLFFPFLSLFCRVTWQNAFLIWLFFSPSHLFGRFPLSTTWHII